MNSIVEIDSAIAASGFLECEVLRTAGIEQRYLYSIRAKRRTLTPKTSQRIRLAIAELKRVRKELEREKATDGRTPSASRFAAQYRIAVGFVGHLTGTAPDLILSADPARRATADMQWLKAVRLRRIALYVANIYLSVPQADLARAAGMSKSNVCDALKEIEGLRGSRSNVNWATHRKGRTAGADTADHFEVDAVLTAIEGAFD